MPRCLPYPSHLRSLSERGETHYPAKGIKSPPGDAQITSIELWGFCRVEIRISKSETNPKCKIRMFQTVHCVLVSDFLLSFGHLNLFRNSSFGFNNVFLRRPYTLPHRFSKMPPIGCAHIRTTSGQGRTQYNSVDFHSRNFE